MNNLMTLRCAALLAASVMTTAFAKADTVQVTASIAGTTTWSSTNEYILNGFIYVLDGGVLNIEAGTVIKAKPGQQLNASCLIVTRGGKIFANGTRTRPIIFTAEADDVTDPDSLPTFQRGLWGGVVLMGKAVLNTCSDTVGNDPASPQNVEHLKYDLLEGRPDTQTAGQFVNRFGGTNDLDNSGVLHYVSIRRAGTVFQPNKELNGLTLCAVGSGTTVDHIEMYAAADDGVEFFGGTVNTKYMVSAFNDDDCFDIDMGYRGKNQFWFAIQEPGTKDHGGEWNGEPNGLTGATPVAPFANFTIYNGTWIGAGTNTTANRGLMIREFAAPKLYNSILTEFAGPALRIDNKAAVMWTNGSMDIRDNLWFNFATNGVPLASLAETNTAGSSLIGSAVFSDPTRSNLVVNPLLNGISRTNNGRLDPRPSAGSPALTSTRTAPDDGFFDPVAYKGAFDANDLWISDWTFLSQKGFLPARGSSLVNVTASIAGTTTWYRTNIYVLNGFIYVLQGGVLNIEAGTIIQAKPGQQLNASCLIVTRGGKIFANGTANNPIIFTAEADDPFDPFALPTFQRGLWGGVVLMGQAKLNTCSDTVGNDPASPQNVEHLKYDLLEGLPDTQTAGQFVNRFGGTNDTDNSGALHYVSIRRAGTVFQPNKELNGLTLCAVGSGTTVDHIEMYAAADDGVEFFGGTVNTKYMVSAFNDDDCFDIDMGYRGKNQFWFAIQEPGTKDHGGEWNGEPNGLTGATPVAPFANFTIYNGTWIGAGTNTTANRGLMIREFAAPKLYNSILTEFAGPALRIDNKAAVMWTNGFMDIRDNIWFNFATNGVPLASLAETNTAGSSLIGTAVFSDPTLSNLVVNPQLRGISRTNNGVLDPRPAPGSPALAGVRLPPNDGFFSPANYKGAFGAINWVADWTYLGERGMINTAGAGIPRFVTGTSQPALAVSFGGGNATVSFNAQPGVSYQVQSAGTLGGASVQWSNEGSPLTGSGPLSATLPVGTTGQKFYRVVAQ